MKMEDIKIIAVLGAGIMGHGITQRFLMGGYPVRLYDIQESILDTARAHIRNNLELFHQAGLIKKKGIKLALENLTTTTALKHAVNGSDFIVEAAPEDLKLKQELFKQVESLCSKDAIIASNTSSLTLTDIGALVKNKERLVITHWFNPPPIIPAVEIAKGEKTNDATIETAFRLLSKIGKTPVKINVEVPGFVVNRIQAAMFREVLDLYEQGVASAVDIDRAVKGSIGFRLASIGPLFQADMNGLDLLVKTHNNLLPYIQSSVEPPKFLESLVAQGHLGIKSGKGFYDYRGDSFKGDLNEVIKKRDETFLKWLTGEHENKIH